MYNSPKVEPDMDCLENLARGLQGKLGLDLIGVDVIIENKTGRYAVVDINAFPGRLISKFTSFSNLSAII